MPSESDAAPEPKDRTKFWWLFVLALFAAMVFALWRWNTITPYDSVVHAKHILITFDGADPAGRARARDLAETLRKRLVEGEDFAQLAKKYSNDPGTAYRGGDLGYAKRGTYVKEFEDYVWNAEIGQLSDVIQTQHGFHLVIVEDRVISEYDKAALEEERLLREKASGQ
ncbi:MAG: peptidyl-prolyl cis-trans isomerase [Candidatus Hydrogenedentes bacterium]|nr:peptidyl-prolyl cis-trans isomerase [Candidatus Hydrogenedentota bacterium]